MKRFLALALSLLMLFSLVACSGNTAPAADADNTQQTEATAPETPDNAEQPQESTETVTGEPKWLADDTSISGRVKQIRFCMCEPAMGARGCDGTGG